MVPDFSSQKNPLGINKTSDFPLIEVRPLECRCDPVRHRSVSLGMFNILQKTLGRNWWNLPIFPLKKPWWTKNWINKSPPKICTSYVSPSFPSQVYIDDWRHALRPGGFWRAAAGYPSGSSVTFCRRRGAVLGELGYGEVHDFFLGGMVRI